MFPLIPSGCPWQDSSVRTLGPLPPRAQARFSGRDPLAPVATLGRALAPTPRAAGHPLGTDERTIDPPPSSGPCFFVKCAVRDRAPQPIENIPQKLSPTLPIISGLRRILIPSAFKQAFFAADNLRRIRVFAL